MRLKMTGPIFSFLNPGYGYSLEVLLMSTHKILFYGELEKIIPELYGSIRRFVKEEYLVMILGYFSYFPKKTCGYSLEAP